MSYTILLGQLAKKKKKFISKINKSLDFEKNKL